MTPEWETWLAKRVNSWAALAAASYDKRARIHALGEPALPLEAGT